MTEPTSQAGSVPPSAIVPRVMFDYESLTVPELERLAAGVPRKVVRWMAAHHPDNRTRRILFELTGVPVGEGTVLNANLTLYDEYRGLVSFGRRVAVATSVTAVAASDANNSHLPELAYVRDHLVRTAPIAIGDDAWLGAQVVILPGVTIGEGAVVGAGAVVVEDVPPYTVVAGVPARVIRSLR